MPPPKPSPTLVNTINKRGELAPEEYRVVRTVSSGEEVIVPLEYIMVLPSTSSFDSGGTVFARKKATKAHKKKAQRRVRRQRPIRRQRPVGRQRAPQVLYIKF